MSPERSGIFPKTYRGWKYSLLVGEKNSKKTNFQLSQNENS